MELEELARHYLEQGYRGAADGALITPNGCQHRGLIKDGGNIYLPEQIGWRIRDMLEAQRQAKPNREDLRGLELTSAPLSNKFR